MRKAFVVAGIAAAAFIGPDLLGQIPGGDQTPLPEPDRVDAGTRIVPEPTPLPLLPPAGVPQDAASLGPVPAVTPEPEPTFTSTALNPPPVPSPPFVLSPERREDLITKLTRAESARPVTPQARQGVEMTEAWAAKSGQFQGQSPVNGSVVLTFNASLPTVVAAVLKVTDVELQAGETVTSVNIGDSARWTVAVTNSNDGELQRPHLIIKPLDEGLQTTLVVTTSRRTYHLFLQSSLERFMHYVTFEYPEDPEMAALQRRRAQEEEALRSQVQFTRAQTTARLPKPISPGPPLASVAYRIEGEAPWQPLYAYTDGKKTYIQMPATMNQTEAPSLLALRRGKGLWGEDKVIVNYRVQRNRYIVDSVLDRAVMVIGREKVTLSKKVLPTASETRKTTTTTRKTTITVAATTKSHAK